MWLSAMTVQKLVVVIKAIDTNEVLERWQFDVECNDSNATSPKSGYGIITHILLPYFYITSFRCTPNQLQFNYVGLCVLKYN